MSIESHRKKNEIWNSNSQWTKLKCKERTKMGAKHKQILNSTGQWRNTSKIGEEERKYRIHSRETDNVKWDAKI